MGDSSSAAEVILEAGAAGVLSGEVAGATHKNIDWTSDRKNEKLLEACYEKEVHLNKRGAWRAVTEVLRSDPEFIVVKRVPPELMLRRFRDQYRKIKSSITTSILDSRRVNISGLQGERTRCHEIVKQMLVDENSKTDRAQGSLLANNMNNMVDNLPRGANTQAAPPGGGGGGGKKRDKKEKGKVSKKLPLHDRGITRSNDTDGTYDDENVDEVPSPPPNLEVDKSAVLELLLLQLLKDSTKDPNEAALERQGKDESMFEEYISDNDLTIQDFIDKYPSCPGIEQAGDIIEGIGGLSTLVSVFMSCKRDLNATKSNFVELGIFQNHSILIYGWLRNHFSKAAASGMAKGKASSSSEKMLPARNLHSTSITASTPRTGRAAATSYADDEDGESSDYAFDEDL